jgi:hypothetical protein
MPVYAEIGASRSNDASAEAAARAVCLSVSAQASSVPVGVKSGVAGVATSRIERRRCLQARQRKRHQRAA